MLREGAPATFSVRRVEKCKSRKHNLKKSLIPLVIPSRCGPKMWRSAKDTYIYFYLLRHTDFMRLFTKVFCTLIVTLILFIATPRLASTLFFLSFTHLTAGIHIYTTTSKRNLVINSMYNVYLLFILLILCPSVPNCLLFLFSSFQVYGARFSWNFSWYKPNFSIFKCFHNKHWLKLAFDGLQKKVSNVFICEYF